MWEGMTSQIVRFLHGESLLLVKTFYYQQILNSNLGVLKPVAVTTTPFPQYSGIPSSCLQSAALSAFFHPSTLLWSL